MRDNQTIFPIFMYTEIFNMTYTIRVGSNQAENDALIKKSSQHAMWFHLKDFPSPHVIVVNTITAGEFDAEVIRRAAMLVKQRAAVNIRGLRKVDVNYLTVKHVQRTETPGTVIMLRSPKCIQV